MIDLSNTIDVMIREVREKAPQLPDDKKAELIHLIVSNNFPVCLEKYIEGSEWKLNKTTK